MRLCLERALCLQRFPSQDFERHNKPEVEVRCNKELLLDPIARRRSSHERSLIEPSINSVRVSVRFKFEDADPIEQILGKKFVGFLMKRAEEYTVMRRIPIEDYSLSLLITDRHIDSLSKKRIISFIILLMEETDKEISSMKISMNSRGRAIAKEFMKLFES